VKVIVGLGNPGVRYQWSRHNVGFQVADRLAERFSILISIRRFKAFYGKGRIDSEEVVLVKPLTYMNRSGEAVKQIVDFFHARLEDLMVVHDDLDLSFGKLRFKRRGGDGGHQGVRSVIERVGGGNFIRLKVGVGRPPKGMAPADYVLSSFDEKERPHLEKIVLRAAESIELMLSEGIEAAMSRYQTKVKEEEGEPQMGP
jgi:PTH1 family peptidyl-tRNA hydrolase